MRDRCVFVCSSNCQKFLQHMFLGNIKLPAAISVALCTMVQEMNFYLPDFVPQLKCDLFKLL